MEGKVEIPKFFIVTLNDKVKDIVFDTDKDAFQKILDDLESNK